MTRDEDNYFRALHFWTMAEKYLHLTRVVSEEVVANKNRFFVMSGTPITAEQLQDETRWTDTNLIEPLLFNFYHGLELMLKGFLMFRPRPADKLNHRLSSLLSEFQSRYPEAQSLDLLFQKYVVVAHMPEMLKAFFKDNDIPVDRFYECLRYPFDVRLARDFNHLNLKYKGKRGLPFFRGLVEDTESIMRESVAISRTEQEGTEEEKSAREEEAASRRR